MTTHVSLRFKHPSENLVMIADGLGLPVARIWTVGETRKTPLGDPLEGKYRESYLALRVVPETKTIAGAVDVVRQAMLAATDRLPVLADPDLKKTLYCTLESEGEALDLLTLRSLVELGIEIEIDGRG